MGFGANSLGMAGLFDFQILIGAAAPCIFLMSQILAGPKGGAQRLADDPVQYGTTLRGQVIESVREGSA